MTTERQPFEDVSPVINDDFPVSCKFSGGYAQVKLDHFTKDRDENKEIFKNNT